MDFCEITSKHFLNKRLSENFDNFSAGVLKCKRHPNFLAPVT